jgi:hypothetical protein
MNTLPEALLSRRGFFMTAARSGFLLALAAFAGGQEIKRRRLVNDPNCIRLSTCAECAEFNRCVKPKAREARRADSPGRV